MSFEITGKLVKKFDTLVVSDRFKKREFVIEKEENAGGTLFTESIKFQLTQNKVDLIDPYNEGDDIKISFNIKGNKWEKDGKVNYFTNLDAWRIENGNAGGGSAPATMDDAPWPAEGSEPTIGADEDDLPF